MTRNMEDQSIKKPLIRGDTPDMIAMRNAAHNLDISDDKYVAMHGQKTRSHTEQHSTASKEWLKIAVFGGLDGIVTLFCVVAGCAGAKLTMAQVLVIGIGNLLGDAISMGFGEYTSAQAEEDFESAEMEREAWEMAHCPEDEQMEMVELYQEKWDMTEEDAQTIVNITWKYQPFFLHNMMVEELDILMDNDGMSPKTKGALMATSFILFGAVPLCTYAIGAAIMGSGSERSSFILVSLASAQRAIKDGILMLLNGSFAGFIAFICGEGLQTLVKNYHHA